MRAVVSTLTFDPDGVVVLDCLPDQQVGELRRRVNRVATLDGGAVVNDAGYSEADRTVELRWTPTGAAQVAAVERLVALYGQVRVSTPRGLFVAALERFRPGRECALSLLVMERLA